MRILKALCIVSGLTAIALPVAEVSAGETFRTKRGKEFHDCEVVGRDPHGVTFRHRGGLAKIAYTDLPDDMQKRFEYDREKEREFIDKHRPKKVRHAARKAAVFYPVSSSMRESLFATYPRGRWANPYLNGGALFNPAASGAAFGGYVQPYVAGSFGSPRLVTSIPNGFYTAKTLRVGAQPQLDSPVAPSMTSYNQMRDARASAVRSAAQAIPAPALKAASQLPAVRHYGGHKGGARGGGGGAKSGGGKR